MSVVKYRTPILVGVVGVLVCSLSACSGGAGSNDSSKSTKSGGATTLTVATASVPQFADIQKLTPEFEKLNPTIKIKYVSLPENQLRDKLTQGVATGSSGFDVVAIGPYEVPLWAQNKWIAPLDSYVKADSSYDSSDLIASIAKGTEYKGAAYSVPFDGESSMMMYRKDIFAKKGLTMPANPTWPQIQALAAKLNDPAKKMAGICMRGQAGWGDVLAPLNTIVNTYGGVWYDKDWKPQLNSPQWSTATNMFVNLQRKYGVPGAASSGFPECLTAFGQGHAAMWYDATTAGGDVEDATQSKVVGKVGYTVAPVAKPGAPNPSWLWSWNLALTSTSKNKDAAWKFMSWATSKQYIKLVGTKLGWARVPPATRKSTYQIAAYTKAAPFADVTLKAIAGADPTAHSQQVPYLGVLFLDLPAYQDFGTAASQEITAAISGKESVSSALAKAQKIAAAASSGNKTFADTQNK